MAHLAADDIQAARVALSQIDPALAVVHGAVPAFEWRERPRGFEGLMRLLIEQQISLAAAAAIWGRLQAGLGDLTPERLLETSDPALRAFGFSASKIRHSRALG